VQEKRKYACVVLDAQFPVASIDVIMKKGEEDALFRELCQIDEEHRIKSQEEKYPPL